MAHHQKGHKVHPTPQPAKPAFEPSVKPAQSALPKTTSAQTEPIRPPAPHVETNAPKAEPAIPNPTPVAEPAIPAATETRTTATETRQNTPRRDRHRNDDHK